jgi:hypothetical protein
MHQFLTLTPEDKIDAVKTFDVSVKPIKNNEEKIRKAYISLIAVAK